MNKSALNKKLEFKKRSLNRKDFRSNRVLYYFQSEWITLAIVTVSGLVYNLGLLAGPWFEGRMAGKLVEILGGADSFSSMLILVLCYVISIGIVQAARYVKRFYVRRFANNVNRRMKSLLYANLTHMSREELESEGAGSVMTKAIQDVDDCAEGMRKFTTEVFDTGVALIAYAAMLLSYDPRLAVVCMLFPPISYFLAEKMKRTVQRTGVIYKKASAALNAATLDRAENAITYRIFGCAEERQRAYESDLSEYEITGIRANIWSGAMPPIYRVISMTGVIFIIYFGARNIRGTGWANWDIAAFTTFLSCFAKLSKKSSSAAKLFNAVHKAQISWKRIQPLLNEVKPDAEIAAAPAEPLTVKNASFAYPGKHRAFSGVTFEAQPGQVWGVTGPVACGKSTLGRMFLCEYPYGGSIRFGKRELKSISADERTGIIGYLGHDTELFSGSIEENILLGSHADAEKYLKAVCMDKEVAAMEDGAHTRVGSGGLRLSGGQAQRLALARTLCHTRPILILDDPFSALDRQTEAQVFGNLRELCRGSIVILITHRLYLFPRLDGVIWLNDKRAQVGTHDELLESVSEYARLFAAQGGANHAE